MCVWQPHTQSTTPAMSSFLASQIHAASSPPPPPGLPPHQQPQTHLPEPPQPDQSQPETTLTDYTARAQWLRAAVLGANDGLVSVASLMIGVGAVSQTARAMLAAGLAGLVAGACSMAIGEFVSVHAQLDMQVAQIGREKGESGEGLSEEEKGSLPSPARAAGASALAFAAGGLLPLLAGGFLKSWEARVGAVCGVTSLGLVGFGGGGAALGGAPSGRSAVRVLVGGWVAMLVTYGVLRLFGLAFGKAI